MSQNIDKVAWIYIKNKKLLAARSKGKTAFYTPGGKRGGSESNIDVLVRELKEELDINIIPESAKFVGEFSAQAHGKQEGILVVMQCYTSDFSGEIKESSEIEEIGWLTSKDINSEITSPVDWIILQFLKDINLIN